MTFLTLVALLLTVPATAPLPDDGDPEEDRPKDHAVQPASDYQTMYMPFRQGRVWVKLGYGTVSRMYDQDGDEQDFSSPTFVPGPGGTPLPATAFGEASSLNLHVGGAYAVSQIGDMNINLGADLGLAQQQVSFDRVVVPGLGEQEVDTELSSGFAPQNLTVFGEIVKPTYTLRAGFLADLSPEEDLEEEQIPNTDEAHAVLLGLSGQYPTASLRLFGGFDYFLTLKDDDFNPGDVISLNGGLGFRLAPEVEVGAALLFRQQTEAAFEDEEQEDTNSRNLSVAPYVTYAPVNAPYQVYVKGAVQREYYDYGYSLTGKNDIAPRLGVTVGVTYGL